ncbi:MAG: hypothetical protein ABIJ46_01095 [bacterium]
MERQTKKRRIISFPIVAAVIFIAVLVVADRWKSFSHLTRGQDNKPTVDFTWTPIGRVRLTEMVGMVRVQDDYAIDFSTLKVQVVELNKTIKISRDDLVGRDYEERVSFAMLAGNVEIASRGQMTLRISVADDAGQVTEIERVIKIEPELGNATLSVPE